MSKYQFKDVDQLAEVFRALSNPQRLRIYLQLVSCCSSDVACSDDEIANCSGSFGRDLGIAPSTISHHLKELRRAGLITMVRRGKHVLCDFDHDVLNELGGLLQSHFKSTELIQ
jgi:ArsR family transcriptional regulator